MTIKERNTSVASFANMDPAKLAERAIGALSCLMQI